MNACNLPRLTSTAVVIAFHLLLSLETAIAQGPLAPSGPPAPTMKTLDQIEPRTDVQKLTGDGFNQYIISQAGSYFLSSNLVGTFGKNGIRISNSNANFSVVAGNSQGPIINVAGAGDISATVGANHPAANFQY